MTNKILFALAIIFMTAFGFIIPRLLVSKKSGSPVPTGNSSMAFSNLAKNFSNQAGLKCINFISEKYNKDSSLHTVLYFNKFCCNLCITNGMLAVVRQNKMTKSLIICDSASYKLLSNDFAHKTIASLKIELLNDKDNQTLSQYFDTPILFFNFPSLKFCYPLYPNNDLEVNTLVSLI